MKWCNTTERSKQNFPNFIILRITESVKPTWYLSSWIQFSFTRFLSFVHFHCLLWQSSSTNDFLWPVDYKQLHSIPEQEWCLLFTFVYAAHLMLQTCLIPFMRTWQAQPLCSFIPVLYHLQPQTTDLTPALDIFLYLFCVNTAHTYKWAHGQPRSVFIQAGDRGMLVVEAL